MNFLRRIYNINLIIIFFSYFFTGLNLLISIKITPEIENYGIYNNCIILGIVMLTMSLISVIDERKEMRSMFATVCTCIIQLAICFVFFLISSYLWMIILVLEIIFEILIILLLKFFTNRDKG